MTDCAPIVCTLTKIQRLHRAISWKGALRRYARRLQRLPNGVLIELKSGVPLAKFRKLVASEAECCRWMNLDLQETAVPPILTITADSDEGVRVILETMPIPRATQASDPDKRGRSVDGG